MCSIAPYAFFRNLYSLPAKAAAHAAAFAEKGCLPMNPKKEAFRKAFIASVPILCSYLFLGMAYGILMQEAGFGWAASLLTSAVVYTGAFQFVLITFLSSGASILEQFRDTITSI